MATAGENRAMSVPVADESRLLEGLRAGDPTAAGDFYDRYASRLFRFIRLTLGPDGDEHDAEDLLQETFMSLADAFPFFRGESSPFTFACAVARRRVAGFRRTRARRARLAPHPPSGAVASGPAPAELDLRAALTELPRESREALYLKYVEGMSVADVAGIQGTTERAVESRLARSRRALRRRLGEDR